jgi:EAL domain-containing protein (putative c-di-GMP-specific phosphodiesterase class I)
MREHGFRFTFAFQPIVDIKNRCIFAHEALVRGPDGQGAAWVLNQVHTDNLHRFDQASRVKIIHLAKRLDMQERVSINFMPNAVYHPKLCIRTTLDAAQAVGFDTSKIIFEVLEQEEVKYPEKVAEIFDFYQEMNFLTALDDFGSGYSGLTLLSELKPDIIKIDMHLVRDIPTNTKKQAIVRGIILTTQELGIRIIAEGIENQKEAEWFAANQVTLQQGYYYAKPKFEGLVMVDEIFPQ